MADDRRKRRSRSFEQVLELDDDEPIIHRLSHRAQRMLRKEPEPKNDQTVVAAPPWEATHSEEMSDEDEFTTRPKVEISEDGVSHGVFRVDRVDQKEIRVVGKRGALLPVRARCRVHFRAGTLAAELEAEVVRIDGDPDRPLLVLRWRTANRERVRAITRAFVKPETRNVTTMVATIVWASAGALALVLAGYLVFGQVQGGTKTIKATRAPVRQVELPGVVWNVRPAEIAAERRTIVRSPYPTPAVIRLEVRHGTRVSAGSVIGRVESRELLQSIAKTSTEVQSYERRLRAIEAQAGDTPEHQKQVDQATAALADAKQRLEKRSGELHANEILAPFDGIVEEVGAKSGDIFAPSAPLYEIIDDKTMRVRIPVAEADAMQLRPGMSVELGVSEDALSAAGVVESLGSLVHDDSEGRYVITYAALRDKSSFIPGMRLRARIIVGDTRKAILLSESAVVGEGTRRMVFSVDANRHAVPTPIQVRSGPNPGELEVLGTLTESSVVVDSPGTAGVTAGAEVRIK